MNLRHEVSNYNENQNVELERAEFSHKLIEERVNKFLQVAGMAINRNNADAKSIASFISTAICELAMMYHPHPLVDIKVGDIVTCNYGYHLKGEISGRYVHSVVCAIEDNMAYLLPITKAMSEECYPDRLVFYKDYDAVYTDLSCKDYGGGSVLLKHGRWLCRERISGVTGYVMPHFMSEIIRILPGMLVFTYDEYEEAAEDVDLDVDILDMEIPELPSFDVEKECVSEVPAYFKNNAIDTTIYQKFHKGLNQFDKKHDMPSFCQALGLPADSYVLEQALFGALCMEKLSKVTNDAVIESMILDSSYMLSKRETTDELRAIFKSWIEANPDIKEKHPKIGISSIFKFFYKLAKNYK